jgi:hypothetical protein
MSRGKASACALLAAVAVGSVAGCAAPTAGSAAVNPSAAIPSPSPTVTTPRPPSGPGPAVTTAGRPATTPPPVVTTTVTTVSTAAPPPTSPATTAPALPPTDLAGEVHGFLTAIDVAGRTVTLDRIDWFTGADARRACAEDGVTDTSNNWCTGYYWRNRNPTLRTVAVSPDATITVLDGSASVSGTLARVAQRIGQATSTYLLVVTDGRVTELHEMYAP